MKNAARLNELICFALYSASNALTRLYRPLLEPLNLTYPQYVVMLALWEEDKLVLGELGRRVHFDSGTLAPLVKRLEAKGWVRRQPAPEDERSKLVALTEAGRTLEQEAAHVTEALLCQVDVDYDSMVQLHELASKAEKAIRQVEKKPR